MKKILDVLIVNALLNVPTIFVSSLYLLCFVPLFKYTNPILPCQNWTIESLDEGAAIIFWDTKDETFISIMSKV